MAGELPFFIGSAIFCSNQSIEEVGKIISENLLRGLAFGGMDKYIYEEVPAIFVWPVLGMRVTLSGYSGFGEDEGFVLDVVQTVDTGKNPLVDCDISNYLRYLLEGIEGITVLDDG